MKRTNTILLAFALLVMMAQCKKENGQVMSDNSENTVTISLNVGSVSTPPTSSVISLAGLKVVVNPATGTVNFEEGDKIYVGSGGKYVGILTHDGDHHFVGNITNPTEGQPLQFYFLGNVTPAETLTAGTTEECSVIISDQTEHLPVISCAASNENYVSGVTSYTGHLLNKCALVKFNVTTSSDSPICITGMKNKVTIDFMQNTVTPSQDGEGIIKLPAGSGENIEKWAILLPQEALEEGEEGSVYSEDGLHIGLRPVIPAIIENYYLAEGINIIMENNSEPVVSEDVMVEWVAANQGYTNQQVITNVNIDPYIHAEFSKGSGSTEPAYYTANSAVRWYYKNTIKVAPNGDARIFRIEYWAIAGSGPNTASEISETNGTYTDVEPTSSSTAVASVWESTEGLTGNKSVTIMLNGTGGHRRITKIVVVYSLGITGQLYTLTYIR